MSIEEMINTPMSVARKRILKNGKEFIFRPLLSSDTDIFGDFLGSLSQETHKRYQPHPLTSESAKEICHTIDYKKTLRFVGIIDNRIVAYFLLDFSFSKEEIKRYTGYGINVSGKNCRIAPVISDAYQNEGIGSIMMEETVKLAKELEINRIFLFGGTQSTNERAVHFYKKFEFQKVGEFEENNMNNFDMYLPL